MAVLTLVDGLKGSKVFLSYRGTVHVLAICHHAAMHGNQAMAKLEHLDNLLCKVPTCRASKYRPDLV